MKFEEMNEKELAEVNGGILGLNSLFDRNSASGSEFVGLGGLGINFSSSSTSSNGSSESTGFGLNLTNLLGFSSIFQS
tara:strand:+ start:108 stop:341 length:234 start_codon:yes stop_codon:yes gene_type:complete